MKFEKYKLLKDKYGFEFAKNGIMLGSKSLRCLQCGEFTKFIEVCSEAHFCSDECVSKWYEHYDNLIANMPELE